MYNIIRYCINNLKVDDNILINIITDKTPDDIRMSVYDRIKSNKDTINKLLYWMVNDKNLREIEILLKEYKANPIVMYDFDKRFETNCVHIACMKGRLDILKLLEDNGANLNSPHVIDICVYHNDDYEIIKYLKDIYNINFDCDVIIINDDYNYGDDEYLKLPLMHAVVKSNRSYDFIKYMICHDDSDIHCLDYEGNTLLHTLSKRRWLPGPNITNEQIFDLITDLIEFGVDTTKTNNAGFYFFQLKCQQNNFSSDDFKKLHELGIDLSLTDSKGRNVLDYFMKNFMISGNIVNTVDFLENTLGLITTVDLDDQSDLSD